MMTASMINIRDFKTKEEGEVRMEDLIYALKQNTDSVFYKEYKDEGEDSVIRVYARYSSILETENSTDFWMRVCREDAKEDLSFIEEVLKEWGTNVPEYNELPTLAEQLGESFEELIEVTKPTPVDEDEAFEKSFEGTDWDEVAKNSVRVQPKCFEAAAKQPFDLKEALDKGIKRGLNQAPIDYTQLPFPFKCTEPKPHPYTVSNPVGITSNVMSIEEHNKKYPPQYTKSDLVLRYPKIPENSGGPVLIKPSNSNVKITWNEEGRGMVIHYAENKSIGLEELIDKMDRAIKAAEIIEQSYQSRKPL